MTPPQMAKLRQIENDLFNWKMKNTPNAREKSKDWTDEQVKEAMHRIDLSCIQDDGHKAFEIIRAWKSGWETGVMEYLIENK